MNLPSTVSRSYALPLTIFILASFFYLYEFILQVSMGVMTDTLMQEFTIDAAGISGIAGFYYYSYAPMQIPAGLLYDRFGPRIVLSIAILICAVGAILFGYTNSVTTLSLSRFMMGLGSAFSFVGVLVLIAHWFEPKYFAVLAGIAQLMSSVGAITGEAPLALSLETYGRLNCLLFLGGVGIVLALLVWMIVKDYPPSDSPKNHEFHAKESEWKKLATVLSRGQTWSIAAYTFLVWCPIIVIATLWGVPYIMVALNVSKFEASAVVPWIWIGIGVGSPLGGWISDHIQQRRLPLMGLAFLGFVATAWMVLYPPHSLIMVSFLMFLFGVAAGGQSLTFAVAKDINYTEHVGTASGINNFATVAGGMLMKPLMGGLLVWMWTGELTKQGVPVYSALVFEKALLFVPLFYLLALIITYFGIKETHCKTLGSNV